MICRQRGASGLLLSLALLACGGGGSTPTKAPQGTISDVAVVVKGSEEPLPFDPRGGRVTVVTQEIKRLVGHPIVLEIDIALSPSHKSSLSETVLASFETIARELVLLQREDPAMFAKARNIERVSLAYDAVGKEGAYGRRLSEGALRDSGKVLAVRAPADHFPMLERWILTQAVYDAYVEDLEAAVLNVGHDGGAHALAFVEVFKDEALFRHGASVLFHDHARRDDVKSALEKAAPRWWRDTPSRRGFALLVMARQCEGLDVHYGDNQWTRFVAEFGGPVGRDVFSSYLAEGPRAVEMTPKIWSALAKGQDRDALVAKSLPVLLERDREASSSRTGSALVLLRKRLCDEKNASGLSEVRGSIARWSKDHPRDGDAASVSNALADFTLARCSF